MRDFIEGWISKFLPKRLVRRCAFLAIVRVTTEKDRFREMSALDLIRRLDEDREGG